MNKINLIEHVFVLEEKELLHVVNSNEEFSISIDGKIEPSSFSDATIFRGKLVPATSTLNPSQAINFTTIFPSEYRVVKDGSKILVKAQNAWQNIIELNKNSCSYDDSSGDGIAEFNEKPLETIGWHATEFDVTYREIVEHLEQICDITLLCIEQAEPYQFSGLGFIQNEEDAKNVAFEFCKNRVIEKMKNDEHFKEEALTSDEKEAAQFFKVI
ncbi:MAG: hypothetical protein U9N42_01155 [Campylobacterota bacterium]|nr:hypothetical protein [Campylobacterota bacterium]